MASKTFTPKYAVVLLIGAIGIVPFVKSLTRSRSSIASWGALAFLLVGLASAAASAAPGASIFGVYLWGTGWLLWVGCAGAFGIGLRLRAADLEWLFWGLVVGAVANACLALYQTLFLPTSGTFGPYQANQADGFLGNPIHLEALLLGVIAIVAMRAGGELRALWRWAPVLLLLSVALEFSTERLAVIVLPALMVILVARHRARGLLASGFIAVGYAIGYLGGGSHLGARVSQGASSPGFHLRLQIWKVAGHALLHHLAIGAGPGLFEAATTPLLTHKLALELGPSQLFADAHDFVIEVAVTTGLLGLACFALWLLGGLARARNTFVLFALAALCVELVEPLNIAITPLVFLTLGASARAVQLSGATAASDLPVRLAPPWRLGVTVLTAAAIVLGGTMIAGDAALANAPPRMYDLSHATRADRLLPYWPVSADAVGLWYQYSAAVTHDRTAAHLDLDRAAANLLAACGRTPFDPTGWAALGAVEMQLGNFDKAKSSYEHALADDPWSADGFEGLGAVAGYRHHWGTAAHWFRAALSVLPASDQAVTRLGLADVLHHELPPEPRVLA